ncbi:MAG: xylF [Gammaproteobacteria bacterium]|jgi:pimeloyl-ACP methyl ester carboxylesterase|nr:xylF [Gammaproteobacteria bacterium]
MLDKETSLEQMVDTILEKAPEKFSFAGHSQGGWVGQALAAKAPERLETLFLMQTFTNQTPEFWEGMASWVVRMKNGELPQILDEEILPIVLHKDKLADQELVERHQRMKKRLSADIYIRQMEAMLNHKSVFEYLPKIKAPTLIIAGREDLACGLTDHELMHKHIKNSALTIIENCGHMACMEQPEAVTALMRLWLTMNHPI